MIRSETGRRKQNGLVFCMLLGYIASAQETINTPITGRYENIPVIELIQVLEKSTDARILYDPERIPFFRVNVDFQGEPLFEALTRIVAGSTLTVAYSGDHIVLINKSELTRDNVRAIIGKWESGEFQKPIRNEAEELAFVFGKPDAGTEGSNYKLQGKIIEQYSSQPVIGAIIRDVVHNMGTVTDEDGRFEIIAPTGRHRFEVTYIGYRSLLLSIDLYADGELSLVMSVAPVNLDEVIVEARNEQNKVERTEIGLEVLSGKSIRELPMFLGEADVIRGLERLPGVSSAGEISSGFNVRGGDVDQNLVLLDEALIFNTSHALGFFSIFQPDAVSTASLYKGNIPAKYGGRLSSVLVVDLKTPNSKRWHGNGGIGIASARMYAEGPLVEEKTSLGIGVRSTYSNWILRRAQDQDVNTSDVYFGDAMIRVHHKISDRSSITATGYYSRDDFQFSDQFGFDWTTYFAGVAWRHLFKDNLALITHLVAGAYRSNQFEPEGDAAFELTNGIDYQKIKSILSWNLSQHFIALGSEVIRYVMQPERITPYHRESVVRPESFSKDQGVEGSVFLEDTWKITESIALVAGIRASGYLAMGPRTVYRYAPGQPISEETVIDSSRYGSGEVIRKYGGIEPRISLSYKINDVTSVKASFDVRRQYVHLISNTTLATPIDIWQLSNAHLVPSVGQSTSFGVFRNLNDRVSISVEGFYHKSDDLIEYRDFAALTLNPRVETQLLRAEGRAYGMEVLLQKSKGRVTGQIAYTRSFSQIKVPGEEIRQGDWYPSNYDQPHQVNFELKYQFNPVHAIQLAFTYKTGRPITPPVGTYQLGTVLVSEFSERNSYRIPDYHRLDLAYVVDGSETKMQGIRSSWTFSLYNVYQRQNAFSIFYRRDSRNILKAYKLSILGAVFPSLTWNMQF